MSVPNPRLEIFEDHATSPSLSQPAKETKACSLHQKARKEEILGSEDLRKRNSAVGMGKSGVWPDLLLRGFV